MTEASDILYGKKYYLGFISAYSRDKNISFKDAQVSEEARQLWKDNHVKVGKRVPPSERTPDPAGEEGEKDPAGEGPVLAPTGEKEVKPKRKYTRKVKKEVCTNCKLCASCGK